MILFANILRALKSSKVGWIGVGFLAVLAFAALFAPWVAPHDPHERVGRPFQLPSRIHLLGTNDIGQDIASEVIWGARVSLTIGILTALLALAVGNLVGLVSGYYGGGVDTFLMRLVDVVLVIPSLPLMIVLAAYLGPSITNIILVVGLISWPGVARVIRSQVLSLREQDYILAARSLGASGARIIFKHIMPGVLTITLAQFIRATAAAILIEASLAFLGLGDPLTKSWGSILYHAQARGAFLTGAWLWWILPPGLLITLTVLGFALTGFALEEVVNPRLRECRMN
jgi:ABC-type dipeptide/oligopeptide/nickel transport system permease subunit